MARSARVTQEACCNILVVPKSPLSRTRTDVPWKNNVVIARVRLRHHSFFSFSVSSEIPSCLRPAILFPATISERGNVQGNRRYCSAPAAAVRLGFLRSRMPQHGIMYQPQGPKLCSFERFHDYSSCDIGVVTTEFVWVSKSATERFCSFRQTLCGLRASFAWQFTRVVLSRCKRAKFRQSFVISCVVFDWMLEAAVVRAEVFKLSPQSVAQISTV